MSHYPALLGRVSGVAQIEKTQLTFISDADASTTSIPISTLRISLEGLNSHHYYFFDALSPEKRICIQDDRAIKELADNGIGSAIEIYKKSKSRKVKRGVLVGSPFLISVASLLAVPLVLSFIPASWLSFVITPQQEKALGQWLLPMIKLQHHIEEKHPAGKQVQELIQRLQKNNPELQKINFETYISTSSDINAFAAPGQIIVLNKGLIEKADSLEEVIGVLAHEMGHIEQKHTIKSLAGGLGSLFGTMILATFIGYDAALLLANASDFVTLKHSRDDESKADERGYHFLHNSKISTEGMISFFNKLAKDDGSLPNILTFASTHPSSIDRVKALTSLAKKYPQTDLEPLPWTIKELQKNFTNTK